LEYVGKKKEEIQDFYKEFLTLTLNKADFDLKQDSVFQFSSIAISLYDINVIYYFFKDNLTSFGLS